MPKVSTIKQAEKSETQKNIEGIALPISFILISVFLLVYPDYISVIPLSRGTSIITAVIGVIGLSVELNKFNKSNIKLGFDNIGIGLALLIVVIALSYIFSNPYVRFLLLVFGLLPLYGFLLGICMMVYGLFFAKSFSIRDFLTKAAVIISQLVGIVTSVLQVIKLFN